MTTQATRPVADRPFKGNKAALPSKPCQACGRPMSWRKRWERNWAEVKYCSDACRRKGTALRDAAPPGAPADRRPTAASPTLPERTA